MAYPPPIHIQSGPTGWVLVKLPYTPERLEKIKTLSGRVWNPDHKCWAIPRTARTIDRLRALFSGDEILIDPDLSAFRPAHPGRRPPIRVPPGSAHEVLRVFAEALRREAYSVRTIAVYVRHAKRFFKTLGKPPAEIEPSDVQHYLHTMQTQNAATYHNQAVRAIKTLLSRALQKPHAYIQAALPPRRPPRADA